MSEEKFTPDSDFLTSFLGADTEYESEDQFKEQFEKTWIRRENAKNDDGLRSEITGKSFGAIDSIVYSSIKDVYEFTPEEKELKTKEKIALGIEKLKEHYTGELEKTKASKGKSNEALEKEWQDKLAAEQRRVAELEDLNKDITQKHETFIQEATTKENNRIKNDAWSGAFGGLEIAKEKTPLEKEGFKSIILSKYEIQLDEDKNPFITDKEGNKIKHDTVADSFMTIEEVLKKEATDNKMLSVNPHKEQPVATPQPVQTQPVASRNDRPPVASPLNVKTVR